MVGERIRCGSVKGKPGNSRQLRLTGIRKFVQLEHVVHHPQRVGEKIYVGECKRGEEPLGETFKPCIGKVPAPLGGPKPTRGLTIKQLFRIGPSTTRGDT